MTNKHPRPTLALIRKVRATEQREARAAIRALTRGDGAAYRAHSAEAAVCGSWLRCYA